MVYSNARVKRKLRKMFNDPSRFTRDMIHNRAHKIDVALAKMRRPSSQRRYSVIAAVYGVERYLNDFFRAITRQSIGFDRCIEVIMVDDGSPDRSAEIISAWQKRYPDSICYIRKHNSGQASARNLGLEYATGDWVTFIDPDDFVDELYFQRVDELIARPDAVDLRLVACKMVVYREGCVSDEHALRSQFGEKDAVIPITDDSTHIQLSAASAFFPRALLESKQSRFDESLRPAFEDAHFIARYLLAHPGGNIGVCSRSRYYYRERSDASSTLDASWAHPGRYGVVMERGYLDLLRASAEASKGRAPLWIQRSVLYELAWHLRVLVNAEEKLSFLNEQERRRYRALFTACFEYIDEDAVFGLNLLQENSSHLVGVLGRFKKLRANPRVFIDRFDAVKKVLRIRYFYYGQPPARDIVLDGVHVSPSVEKTRRHEFLGEALVAERIVWLPVSGKRVLQVLLDGSAAEIEVRGRPARMHVDLSVLEDELTAEGRGDNLAWFQRAWRTIVTSGPLSREYSDCLLFMDRDSQADDNAEHLYRYVLRQRPELRAFFVLREDSSDWARLYEEGFRLIPFGSARHRIALANARHLISSHADTYVLAFPTVHHRRTYQRSHFTFLQHGVIKDDLSGWLNGKDIDLFITSSPAEYASIVEDPGPYKFTSREVVLTGLPRHDALGAGQPEPQPIVLIMPTWRKWLVGPQVGKSAVRAVDPSFYGSQFARYWKSVLHSPRLSRLAVEFGYRVQFFPHANLDAYLDWFAAPDFVEALSVRSGASMQSAFRTAGIMITDYSSTAFEMAYLRRSVIYYQFDRDRTFGGGHTTRKGYFDYSRDGFGPVCRDEDSLFRELERLMQSRMTPAPEHLERMERAFAFRDGQSCRRTLDAILALDRPS